MTRTSTLTGKLTAWGLLAALAATTAAPVLANPDNQQTNKNQWRNLGVAGAVIAGYGLLTGNKDATILGAVGGAYSANRYEQDRHNQSQDNSYDGRRYHRTYGWQAPVVNNNDNRYTNGDTRYNNDNRDNNGYDRQSNQGGNSGWSDTQTRHDQDGDRNHGSQDGNRDTGHRG